MKKILGGLLLGMSVTLLGCEESSLTQIEQEQVDYAHYDEFSQSKLQAALRDKKRVVLFFYSDQNMMCAGVNTDIIQNIENIPPDMTIFKINIDQDRDLANNYGISSSHSFFMVHKNAAHTGTMLLDLPGIIQASE